ncbi:uroporphyrinogen-III synthase [Parahaliea sp. F7430]|uniref:Uroporphyrinogen-III synthase n=1 Tax=Sediminihaliea albiluteola TaxID=2758564 RepID=A0A7W2YKF5_9GAMM|nr:uroporphyrinogen-III synthase [Sediminihaliea albiluteola]MBA6413283.1 uroporphyrinogen-III synthase [Sediminihaliea albiluteola]
MVAKAVLITRPEGQGAALGKAVEALGLEAVYQPVIELEPYAELPAEQHSLIQDLDYYQHIIFVSSNAVRFAMPWLENQWPQWPVGINWYAVGSGTARELKRYGLEPLTPGIEMTSEGLLKLAPLSEPQGDRVLIVKGDGGREFLRETLEQRGAQVDRFFCYRRKAVQLPPQGLANLLDRAQVGVVLISSGEGLGNFLALLSPAETTKLWAVTLVLPSQRVAAVAQEAGFKHLIVADNASDEAMLRALKQWQNTQETFE